MNYYNEIKNEIIDIETYKKVKDYSKNKRELEGYYTIGQLIIEAQGGEKRAKYGDNLIKEYSKKLTKELGKGYSTRNLKLMRKFYLFQKGQTLSTFLSWSHYIELLPLKDINEIEYYIKLTEQRNLGVRRLRTIIKSKEYERLDAKAKERLINNKENKIGDFIKHPILIKNTNNHEYISERLLQKLILEDMENFLNELGDGYCFLKSEYKIKIENTYNYIDILLFNIKYNCYTIVELKTTKLKKEHIGQIEIYMNYIDTEIKTINHNKTIGIIICRENNNYIIKYCSNPNIHQTTYLLENLIDE